jgi:signal transduction histidine kinase
MIKINKQLGKYFIFISLLCIAFITLIANISITLFFSNYIKESRIRDDQKVVQYMEQVYSDYNQLNSQALMSMVHYTFSESVAVRLRDMQDNIIWNSSTSHLITDMGGELINESSLTFKNYPFKYKGEVIGSIDVGRPGSIISSIEDQQFLSTINIVFAIAFIFSVIISMLLSTRISKKFLEPIYLIINNTKLIKSGKFKQLQTVDTDTYELNELSRSILELSEKLNYQELLRRRMTSDMAHELRTPLATLQSHIEAFMDKIWEPDEKRLGMVHEEILRLTGLIKELSDLSIIEGEEIKINKSQVNLSKLIRNIIEKYQPMFIGKNITANIAVENDVVLEADENHLNRIFINLISNAYKYTNENGNLYISLIKLSGFIQVTVEDTGIGIPEEDIKYVFERFYRSDLSRNRGTGGTGIGLTIAKSLIEANQGKISIESVEGKGTKVTCIFYA